MARRPMPCRGRGPVHTTGTAAAGRHRAPHPYVRLILRTDYGTLRQVKVGVVRRAFGPEGLKEETPRAFGTEGVQQGCRSAPPADVAKSPISGVVGPATLLYLLPLCNTPCFLL